MRRMTLLACCTAVLMIVTACGSPGPAGGQSPSGDAPQTTGSSKRTEGGQQSSGSDAAFSERNIKPCALLSKKSVAQLTEKRLLQPVKTESTCAYPTAKPGASVGVTIGKAPEHMGEFIRKKGDPVDVGKGASAVASKEGKTDVYLIVQGSAYVTLNVSDSAIKEDESRQLLRAVVDNLRKT